MKAAKNKTIETRMFDIEQASAYIGKGKTAARVWLKEIGARRSYGRMVRYDRTVIDKVLDQMTEA